MAASGEDISMVAVVLSYRATDVVSVCGPRLHWQRRRGRGLAAAMLPISIQEWKANSTLRCSQ